eukprot:GHVN01005530.1.p2 GENE.GHVN01005530.1~~GHVN01005530.1.p2  ORF type:complete len:349 (+),score=49.98 GHVN01005530.1:155-1048(+)
MTEERIKTIRNKARRVAMQRLLDLKKRRQKTLTRRERQDKRSKGEHVEETELRTIDKERKLQGDIVDANDEEVQAEDKTDEFAPHFEEKYTPKLMVTTSLPPSKRTELFLKEMTIIIPNIYYFERKRKPLKKILKWATEEEFTAVLVVQEAHREPCGLYVCSLPEGPTSFFRMTRWKPASEDHTGGATTDHLPEIVLNNFDTAVGHRIGRQLASLFPQRPEFVGRRVITLHNQRDFIFFRHHRYVFSEGGKQAYLQEVGPRFTLKLHWLQHGTFDSNGQYEFVWRPELSVDKKMMYI